MNKNLLKRIISLCLAILISISCCSIVSFAKNENEHRNSLEHSIYVTDNKHSKKESKQESIQSKNIADISDAKVCSADVVIINFEELYNDEDFANEVAEQIRCGKVFYIRAEGYSANRTIISQVLGIKDNVGFIRENTDEAIKNREGTFGYIVFVDVNGNLQIVRQLISLIDQTYDIEEIKADKINIQAEDNAISNISETDTTSQKISDINFAFTDELDAIDSFFDEISPTDIGKYSQKSEDYLVPQSTFNSYAYEVLYSTEYCYKTVKTSSDTTAYKKVGAITIAMYAERMYCATSNWSNTDEITSKWGYMADVWVQPTWNQSKTYRSMNYTLSVRFNTYPLGANNDTYLMFLRDFAPTVDLSGDTQATLSVGADTTYENGVKLSGSAGFSVTTSYEDVEITVPYWRAGDKHSNNVAG